MTKNSQRGDYNFRFRIFFANREQYTLQLLNKFKAKLDNLRSSKSSHDDNEGTSKADVDDEELNTDKWMVNEKKWHYI